MEMNSSEPWRWQDKVKQYMDVHLKTCQQCISQEDLVKEAISLHIAVSTHYDNSDLVDALEASVLEMAVWEKIGCVPDCLKFHIWFYKASCLGSLFRYDESLALVANLEVIAPTINKHAEEDLMKLKA